MPPRTRKTAAKKSAARKTPPPKVGPRFPLVDGGYLSPSPIPKLSTSRGAPVVAVRVALGLTPGPAIYDQRVREAVMAFQREHGLKVTGVVALSDWEALFARSAAPSGGVDGADEPDGPAGQLDPPQGP